MLEGTRPSPPRSLRKVGQTVAIASLALATLLLTLASPASAAPRQPVVDVVQVSGWLDPVVVDFLETSITRSERAGAEALIIQLDSPGALVKRATLDRLVERIAAAEVPV